MVGRPALWGLAVNGKDGVRHVLEILRAELELAMVLCGCPTLAQVNRSLVKLVPTNFDDEMSVSFVREGKSK
jgi:4-hydroxymandelate oxidase